jgi:hypothetical protein
MWDGFDGNNITDEQRNELLADMYGGYKQKQGKEIYVEKGAGDGRARVGTGRYKTSTNLDYYKNHPGWKGVADAADISSINSLSDLGQMADYVSHYGKDKGDDSPPEETPEPSTEETKEPILPSARYQKAQDLVDKYTSDITNGKSPYSTQVFSGTPNFNTQTEGSDDTFESNTFADPKYSLDTSDEDAANSFLKSKKLELNSGLNLQ